MNYRSTFNTSISFMNPTQSLQKAVVGTMIYHTDFSLRLMNLYAPLPPPPTVIALHYRSFLYWFILSKEICLTEDIALFPRQPISSDQSTWGDKGSVPSPNHLNFRPHHSVSWDLCWDYTVSLLPQCLILFPSFSFHTKA